jgi:hypothetical protein
MISGPSQIRVQRETDNRHDEYRKQQIGGECREELRQGLDFLGEVRPQTDLHSDRDPNQ